MSGLLAMQRKVEILNRGVSEISGQFGARITRHCGRLVAASASARWGWRNSHRAIVTLERPLPLSRRACSLLSIFPPRHDLTLNDSTISASTYWGWTTRRFAHQFVGRGGLKEAVRYRSAPRQRRPGPRVCGGERWNAIVAASAALAATPSTFDQAHFDRLGAAGLEDHEIAVHAAAFLNRANRLMLSLSETTPADEEMLTKTSRETCHASAGVCRRFGRPLEGDLA